MPAKSSTCLYGECNGHKTTTETIFGSYCEKHKPIETSSSNSSILPLAPQLKAACRCSRTLNFDDVSTQQQQQKQRLDTCHCPPSVDSRPIDDMDCTPTKPLVCIKCSSIEMENSKTKSKLEQLRLVMQQKKERREARKLQGSPYGACLTTATATAAVATTNSTGTSAMLPTTTNDVSSPTKSNLTNIVEEVDSVA